MARKKNDTQMAFLDLMLCAIGCALLIFMAQVLQPRAKGREWDDKPLVVSCRAVGPPKSRFIWELARENATAGNGRVGGGAHTLALPESLTTESGQPMLFIVPEAEFGNWRVSVTAQSDPGSLESLLGQLRTAGLMVDSISDLVRVHRDLYSRYLVVIRGPVAPGEANALARELETLMNQPVSDLVGLGIKKDRPDAELYLRCRRLLLLAELQKKASPADAERVQRDTRSAVLKALADNPFGAAIIGPGVLAELELWETGRPGSSGEELNRRLDRHRTVEGDLTPDGPLASYAQEFIRLRATNEWVRPEDRARAAVYKETCQNYKSNLTASARIGADNVLFLLIAAEFGALGQSDQPPEARIAVIWGRRWPEVVTGAEEAATHGVVLPASENGRPVVLGTIALRRGSLGPLVVPGL